MMCLCVRVHVCVFMCLWTHTHTRRHLTGSAFRGIIMLHVRLFRSAPCHAVPTRCAAGRALGVCAAAAVEPVRDAGARGGGVWVYSCGQTVWVL